MWQGPGKPPSAPPYGGRGPGRAPRREGAAPRSEPALAKLTQRAFLRWRVPSLRVGRADLAPLEPLTKRRPDTPTDAEFAGIGKRLAAAKSRLDSIPEKDFETLMGALDLYRGLKRTFRDQYGFLVATNATLKMHELLIQEKLLSCDTGAAPHIRMFADAELPGAFLAAANHYVRTMCPASNFDWVASSYYPEAAAKAGDSTILGDHYGIYAQNRGRWLMGPRPNAMPEGEPDVSGDLTDPNVVAALANAVHARFGGDVSAASGATLYTSDAGIDVSGDYSRQEEDTALLNFGQVLCGILSLAPGGHLVTKQYTFLTPFSRSLIAVLAALFDEVEEQDQPDEVQEQGPHRGDGPLRLFVSGESPRRASSERERRQSPGAAPR